MKGHGMLAGVAATGKREAGRDAGRSLRPGALGRGAGAFATEPRGAARREGQGPSLPP